MKLFVEGGGDSNELRTRCREGFCRFLSPHAVSDFVVDSPAIGLDPFPPILVQKRWKIRAKTEAQAV